MGRRENLLALCLLFFVAVGLRAFQLEALPPGVHFDEAANGLLASEIAFQGERPIFLSSYTGKEVLFFYAAAGVMRLVEPSVFGLRLTAVYLSLLTLAATFWLGMELFRDRRIALLATTFLALSFWHLLFSRLGFRAISQPLLQALMVAAWLRGLRTQQGRWFMLSGLFLGLAAYTYLAVRLFPLLLLLAAIPLLWQRPYARQRLTNHLLLAGVGLLVAAPLLLYFWQNPDAFWVRITQVSPSDEALTVWEGVQRASEMFFISGDPYIRFNVPLRPLFNPILSGLMGMGFLMLLWQLWKRRRGWQSVGILLLLLAPFVMLLPTALAVNEIVPSNLRAIGLIPFLFFLPAVPLGWLLARIRRRWLTPLLIILLMGWLGWETAVAYFDTWANDPTLLLESDGDLAAVAQFLETVPLGEETIYVASPHYQHPTVALLSQRYGQVKWLPNSQALVFPNRSEAIIIYPAKSRPPSWAEPFLDTAVLLEENDLFTAYRFDQTPPFEVPQSGGANFSNAITLLGYDVRRGSDSLNLLLYWSIDGQPPTDVLPFVHLEDATGYRWSQVETFAYPTSQWERGELMIQQVVVPILPGTPPGMYGLKLGLFDPLSGGRLAQFDENGRYAGDAFAISNIPLSASNPSELPPAPSIELNISTSHNLQLRGIEPIQSTVATGERLPVVLHWFATGTVPQTTMRFSLLKMDGVGGRILANRQPVYDSYPFEQWQTPQYLTDRQLLPVPEDMEAGDYLLTLRLLNGADETIGVIPLGEVAVEKTERLFTQPEVAQPIRATFGNEIALVGYEVEKMGETAVELTLVWQALKPPNADYTVFVHLLTPEGGCTPCVWQQDVMPQQNQYPTSRWRTNEYIIDTYRIELPSNLAAGSYPIEVGLYLANSGIRLQVNSEFPNTGDAVFLESLKVE